MLFIILTIVITIIIFLLSCFDRYCDKDTSLFIGMVTPLLCIATSLVIMLSINILNTGESDIEYQTVETVNILCLEDSKNVEGSYYLLNGTVDEELCYYYMYNDPSLGRTTDKIPADVSYINYVNDNFRIETLESKHKNRFLGFWLGQDYFLNDVYKVYIPEGSITVENNYNIDLK